MTVVPAAMVFRNQSVQGTLVSNMADVDETLDFAKRGRPQSSPNRQVLDLTDVNRQAPTETDSGGNFQI